MSLRLAVAATLLTLLVPGVTRAHVVSDREVKLVRELPPGLIASAARGDQPDSLGRVGPNRRAWTGVQHQAGALLLLVDASSRADSAAAEAAWKAIDAAFVQQQPSGHYLADAGSRPDSAATLASLALWVAELSRAEIALMNGPLQDRFRWRVTLMLPKLRRSVDALAARGDAILRLHQNRADLLLVDAQACLLADGIYHEPAIGLLGQRLLVTALALQKSDGDFAGKGATALGRQARALASLIEIVLYFPAPSLEKASARAAESLEHRLGEQRRRSVDPAEAQRVTLRDALVALAYQSSLAPDAHARDRVAQTITRWLPELESAAR